MLKNFLGNSPQWYKFTIQGILIFNKINKLIYCIVLLFLFSACQPLTEEKEQTEAELHTENLINKIEIHDLEILEIDNCQYIFYKKSPNTNKGFGFMAHKGNCKNPIHCHNKNSLKPEE